MADKIKAVPQHTYVDAVGEKMYTSYSFTTSVVGCALLLGKGPPSHYPLDRRLGGLQSRSEHRG
jgi:hypothetical protein